MIERKDQMQGTLDALTDDPGMLGAALVSRDGIPVLSSFTPSFDQRTFSILVEGAMVATLLGAAEEAMTEMEAGDVHHITVETETVRMIVQGISDDLVFVVITETDVPVRDVLEPLAEAVEHVQQVA